MELHEHTYEPYEACLAEFAADAGTHTPWPSPVELVVRT